ncbi:tol-pal system protein YbgF [Pseudochrobactrum asaccharolyticum]|jgi:tol-pal system protein YbgF|uniref:Cell division coordinator CpoB n=1 Tax=Pseudochrobactrum asaccharolyticum TaxID=354351 RepID=A0A366DUA3_9HYPH|nr:tol-pal system protein YbgF [Pseudochrobactrum asaccharolyticum]MBX8801748.1 tol-pal system protein YbgF [Ochrobactrum sp. MR28]MBX8816743.1 tol-pal system protein YbgF [Ochrobactrum sp. MR31]MDR2309632.1 tol-pal system protein YbgF [Brucellaceae bacterium]RBO93069.1 tol-pal system protein YbgF [Pseudochrobactrum asaccharolyticum]
MKKAIKKLALTVSLLPLFGMAFGGTTAFAQANDQRVIQLQEQVRNLTGKLEEMNFQILQMQEQMRKIQEDNEFRFEELEKKKKADAGSDASINTAAADSAAVGSADETGDKEPRRTAAADAGNDNVAQDNTDLQPAQDATADNSADSVATGQQTQITVASQAPRALGSIRFDASGNVIGGSLTEEPAQPVALPQTDNPNELYNAAYQYILAGDYRSAEAGFRAHIDRYPADPMTSDARYWLGEALYGQERYAESATVFIDMQRDYPDSKRGAENMLKLGMAMAKLNDREVACATFAKVGSRFPSAAPAVLKRVDEERKLNHC